MFHNILTHITLICCQSFNYKKQKMTQIHKIYIKNGPHAF